MAFRQPSARPDPVGVGVGLPLFREVGGWYSGGAGEGDESTTSQGCLKSSSCAETLVRHPRTF